MSKTLFVGDIHTKFKIIDKVERIIEDPEITKVVFVGDYVDDFGAVEKDNINILETIFNFKKKYGERVILLAGNHSLSYLGYPCSGHIYSPKTEKLLKDNIDLLNVIYKTDKYMVSHGGLTSLWLKEIEHHYGLKYSDELIKQLNDDFHELKPEILHLLSQASYTSGGRSYYASILWSRFDDHEYFTLDNVTQIVGHTPIRKSIKESVVVNKENNSTIYYIDSFSTYRDGTPVGKEDFLLFDEDLGEFLFINKEGEIEK